MGFGRVLSDLPWTKSSDSSVGSSKPCVSSVSGSIISNPFTHATHNFVRKKWMELDCTGMKNSLYIRSVSCPPCNCVPSVGLLRPRWSIGSNILIVLDRGLVSTTQTNVRPEQTPDLKNEVCEEMRSARPIPASGSIASSASRGNALT